MQNRYVGDIGDFAKYALLRSVTQSTTLSLGIVWYLFGDERHNSDGRHIGYLNQHDFRKLDTDLYDKLRLVVRSDRRSVAAVSASEILPNGSIFFDAPVLSPVAKTPHERINCRINWAMKSRQSTSGCDLVFFDPDNGLETPSVPYSAKKAGKYVFWHELDAFWDRGQSLIVYHHLNRRASAREQTEKLWGKFADRFPGAALVRCLLFRRGSCRHFWIVAHKSHAPAISGSVDAMLRSGWDAHFDDCSA